jgi:hypothetical protein
LVVIELSASGSGTVDAVFDHEAAAREYVASQLSASVQYRTEAHLLHRDAPAPLYGLLARTARAIDRLGREQAR